MTRNLKALGLAVFALGATAAAPASAIDTFTTSVSPITLTGVSTNGKFEITSLVVKVECTTAHGEATVSNGASSATIIGTYTGMINQTPHGTAACTAAGGSLTVTMNGCDYYGSGETTGSDGGQADATVSLTCPPGHEVIFDTSLGCTVKIPAQTPTSGGVTFTNEAGGKVRGTSTITGTTYTTEGFACALIGLPSEADNTDFLGSVVVSSPSGSISYSES